MFRGDAGHSRPSQPRKSRILVSLAEGPNTELSTDMEPGGFRWLTSKYTSKVLARKLNMIVVITTWLPR